MAIYLISYDLIPPGQHYPKVHAAIKAINPNSWAKPLESLWLVETSLTVPQVRDRVTVAMDSKDKLLVVDVSGRSIAAVGLTTDVWKWIEQKL